MKRQIAITGPTPEFLRWSIRLACPLRDGTALDSVDQTEKRLRAIRIAGAAIEQNEVFNGIAVREIQSRVKGFRVSEIFQFFGGLESVQQSCGECPANGIPNSRMSGSLAGCHGWLPRRDDARDPCSLIENALTREQRRVASQLFISAEPVWYSFWTEGNLQQERLQFVADLFRRLSEYHFVSEDVTNLERALKTCVDQNMVLDVELVPAGFSDGLRWTIAEHCDRCKASFDHSSNGCQVCKKPGRGHPVIHRKVRGLRPWVDLAVVLGPDHVEAFLEKYRPDHR